VSLAVFALVVVIWVVLLVPLARRGRAELAYEASEGGRRLSSGGARPWTTGNLPAEPTDEELEAAAAAARLARRRDAARRAAVRRRRVLLVLVAATTSGSRAWAALGGRWWLAAAAAAVLLAGYLLTLVAVGWRRARRGRTGRGATAAPPVTAAATA
jgi:membrane protein YdbS with pleckstrin-like domain